MYNRPYRYIVAKSFHKIKKISESAMFLSQLTSLHLCRAAPRHCWTGQVAPPECLHAALCGSRPSGAVSPMRPLRGRGWTSRPPAVPGTQCSIAPVPGNDTGLWGKTLFLICCFNQAFIYLC